MANENVDNYFQRTDGGSTDNTLVLGGTVVGRTGTQAPNVPDASDLASAITLANALKVIAIDIGAMAPNP